MKSSSPLQKYALLPRIDGIEKELAELKSIVGPRKSSKSVLTDTEFAVGCFHLQHVLEGIMNISSHIIARIPGSVKEGTRYQDIARAMVKTGILPKSFAEIQLVKMAGYRNRLVHHYAEITKSELKNILTRHLDDCDFFLKHINALIKNPKKYGFTLE